MRTMWLFIFTLVVIGMPRALSAQEAPPYKEWRPEFNSVGSQLLAREVERHKTEGVTVMRWHFSATGLPKDEIYKFWVWELGRDPQFGMDTNLTQSGELVYRSKGNNPEKSDPIEVVFFAVPGEPKRFALVSADGQFRAFGETIPFPIEAKDKECRVSVIMLAPLYNLVSIRAEGLRPNEGFHVRLQSGHEIGLLKPKADATGKWSVDVGPYVKGKNRGFTSVELTGAECKLKTVFPWGVHFYQ